MKFGLCGGGSKLDLAAEVGADYVEMSASAVYDMSDEMFDELEAKVKKSPIKPYSCNGLVPGRIRLTGEDVNMSDVSSYAEKTFFRLARLGIKYCVFGSSTAKNVPEGFPMDEAWKQITKVGRMLADIASQYGQIVVAEPLSYTEANIVNTVKDGVKFAELVDRDNFTVLADFYHFTKNKEDLADIVTYREYLRHFHIAAVPNRDLPLPERDKSYIEDIFRTLKEIGYDGGVSLECGLPDSAETVKKTIDWFKELAK